MRLINKFLRSDLYDKLPFFVARKFFKYSKIFYVETDLKNLPEAYKNKINYDYQKKIITESKNNYFKPNNSCSNLLKILKKIFHESKKINFFDFGGNNIDTFLYLNKNFSKLNYYYYDQADNMLQMERIKNEYNFHNLKIIKDLNLSDLEINFVFFGRSIQYIKNFGDILNLFIKKNPEFILFSLTPFYTSLAFSGDLIMKQVNVYNAVFYSYFFDYSKFIKNFEKENYEVVFSEVNNNVKFLNFKNFERTYKSVNLSDVLLKRTVNNS